MARWVEKLEQAGGVLSAFLDFRQSSGASSSGVTQISFPLELLLEDAAQEFGVGETFRQQTIQQQLEAIPVHVAGLWTKRSASAVLPFFIRANVIQPVELVAKRMYSLTTRRAIGRELGIGEGTRFPAGQGVGITSGSTKGRNNQSSELLFPAFVKAVESVMEVAIIYLLRVCTEQTIPDRENVGVV